jgi:ceramide glucosyltransferase
MTHSIADWLSIFFLALSLAGCCYTLAATLIVRRWRAEPLSNVVVRPPVTILKPLHNAERGLYENAASFCDQIYFGPVQILFGVQDESDSAIPVIERLIAERPGMDIELVIDRRRHGANRKVSNLINLGARSRHEILVLADSDIRVAPNYLEMLISVLDRPGVGLVTCLYRGTPQGGVWARLTAMAIDYQFLPSILVGLALRLARPCFGSTVALRRDTLAAIGGFDTVANDLADDYALGAAVRRAGFEVAIAPQIVEHLCTNVSASQLLSHELRWARTIRAVDRWGFAGSAVTHPLPLALIGAAFAGFGVVSLCTITAALACRLVLKIQVDHALGTHSGRWWLAPVRDALSFLVFAVSFFIGAINWRGQRYKVRRDGTVAVLPEVQS